MEKLVLTHLATAETIINAETPDPEHLARLVHLRLRELGMSVLAASKLGFVSRSTLSGLADRIPNSATLTNLDDLLAWEPGSAQAALYGREPIAREHNPTHARPVYDPDAPDDYLNLTRWIEGRLKQLNMTKVRFAEISGVGRSTLATLGKRGPEGRPYTPTPRTLELIDLHLMWEPGSAAAALKGGTPIRRGPVVTPHPALIPVTAIKDRLKSIAARLARQRDAIEQSQRDVAEAQKHVDQLAQDFRDPRRASWTPPTDDDTEPNDD